MNNDNGNGRSSAAISVADPEPVPDVRHRVTKLVRDSLVAPAATGNPVLDLIREHFGCDPVSLPQLHEGYTRYLSPGRQFALDEFLGEPGRTHTTHGVIIPTDLDWDRLSDLLLPPTLPMPAPRLGPIGEDQVEVGYKVWKRCLTKALILVRDEQGPSVIWVSPWAVEVMAPTAERAIEVLKTIRALSVELSPYRGQCISVALIKGCLTPQFEERPTGIEPDDVILPPGLLTKIEEHVVGIAQFSDVLRASGRHLKRGLLLWGRPGTGKTHTIRYLSSRLPDHTVLILPGQRLANLHSVSELIELCVPGIVVLDDVDYIAEDRSMPGMSATQNLFELLDTLDGVHPDVDLLFILTTNRADTIEPAVAARPGRVDQVVEIPPPDADCRRRLFDLYATSIDLDMDDAAIGRVVARTEGVTGSFFKELLRRATLDANARSSGTTEGDGASEADGDGGGRIRVGRREVEDALEQMLDPASPVTQRLLGLSATDHQPLGADQ